MMAAWSRWPPKALRLPAISVLLVVAASLGAAVSTSGCLDDCTGMRLSWGDPEFCPAVAEHPAAESRGAGRYTTVIWWPHAIEAEKNRQSTEMVPYLPGCLVLGEIRLFGTSEQNQSAPEIWALQSSSTMVRVSIEVDEKFDEAQVSELTERFLVRATDLEAQDRSRVADRLIELLHQTHVTRGRVTTGDEAPGRLNEELHEDEDVSVDFGPLRTNQTVEGTPWHVYLGDSYWHIDLGDWSIDVLPGGGHTSTADYLTKAGAKDDLRGALKEHGLPVPARKDISTDCDF